MKQFNITDGEIVEILDTLVALLLLGNLTISENPCSEIVEISPHSTLTEAAQLLKLDTQIITNSITTRLVKYPG